jgi:hypothetical protein
LCDSSSMNTVQLVKHAALTCIVILIDLFVACMSYDVPAYASNVALYLS